MTLPATTTATTLRIPSRDDPGTMSCPVCRRGFTPVGRQAYCGTACRKTAFRRRHRQAGPADRSPSTNAPTAVNDCWASNAARTAAPSPAGSVSAACVRIVSSRWP